MVSVNLFKRLCRRSWDHPIVRVPDKLDTSEGDTPVATEFAKMTTALRDEMDAAKWRRAKAYITQQIEAHQRALDAGGIDLTAYYTHAVKRDVYKTILDRAEPERRE